MVDVDNDLTGGETVSAVRRFNRFYTRRIGVLEAGLLKTPFSLGEARILFEIAHRERPTAAELARDLGLDPGYLSRILAGFAGRGLIDRTRAEGDGRQSLLTLTAAGRAAFAELDRRSREAVAGWLDGLSPGARSRLLHAMAAIEGLLGETDDRDPAFVLRSHQPGDIGWVIHRQGRLYAEEYGWDETYEALVAEILAKFIHEFDPRRERSWIAERQGEVVGSVFLVRESDDVAKLRLLYVEAAARGLGIGQRLVDECIAFARRKQYRTLTLWTNDILVAARTIYEAAGFRLVSQARHKSFGKELVGQTWELDLGDERESSF